MCGRDAVEELAGLRGEERIAHFGDRSSDYPTETCRGMGLAMPSEHSQHDSV